MIDYLNKLLANFVVMEYKVHSMHTDIQGSIFIDVHNLLGEIYSFFGSDNRDTIKERIRILKDYSISSLAELIDLSEIDEISKVPTLAKSLEVVFSDLESIEACLKEGKDLCTKENDLDTQQLLIDWSLAVGKFRYKVSSILGKA